MVGAVPSVKFIVCIATPMSALKLKFHGNSFLVASSSDTTDTPDFLVTC